MRSLLATLAGAALLMVNAAAAHTQGRLLTAQDVSLQLRLADKEEVPTWPEDPCRNATPEQLECRPLALIVENHTRHTVKLAYMACGDMEVTIEIRPPREPWHVPPGGAPGMVSCTANAPQGYTIPPGGHLLRPLRLLWNNYAAGPLRGPMQVRAIWDMVGCVDDDPGAGCIRKLLDSWLLEPDDMRKPQTPKSNGSEVVATMLGSPPYANSNAVRFTTIGIPLLPGTSRDDYSPPKFKSDVVTSQKLQQSYWFTSDRLSFHPSQQMLLEFHIRNLGKDPIKVGNAAGWPICGPFDVLIRAVDGPFIWEVKQLPLRVISAVSVMDVLNRGEASRGGMVVDGNNSTGPKRLPGPGEYSVDVSPLGDPATHLHWRVKLLAQ